jgi:Na+/melibiose symporter-like transporter
MIMADVFAVFGTLLAVGIALPGLLLTWQLLLPKFVDRAEQRLDLTPWKCFFVGTGLVLVSLLPLIILFNLPGFQALGFVGVFSLLAVTSLGAAGLASLMGQRLHGLNVSPAGATIRGAVAMELAAAFPLVGWFVFIPLTCLITFGAAVFALLGWEPRASRQSAPTDDTLEPETSAPGIDLRQALHNR